QIIQELDWLRDAFELETAAPGVDSMELARFQTNIAELCGLLNTLVAEDIRGTPANARIDDDGLPEAPELIARVANPPAAVRRAEPLQTGNDTLQKRDARLLANAKHSEGDQALVDMALYSCGKRMKLDGRSIREREH